jgi:hypothetical protein
MNTEIGFLKSHFRAQASRSNIDAFARRNKGRRRAWVVKSPHILVLYRFSIQWAAFCVVK